MDENNKEVASEVEENKDSLNSEKTAVLTKEELEEDLKFANAVASLCVTKHGGLPALPVYEEVEKLLKL